VLFRLLELLTEGGTHSSADLARSLGVSAGLLEDMVRDLTRMGYLRRVSGECAGGCSRCPHDGVCAIGAPDRVWTLTDKGQKQRTAGVAPRGGGQGRSTERGSLCECLAATIAPLQS
jgi:predicted ArsR family transcriptional regulator